MRLAVEAVRLVILDQPLDRLVGVLQCRAHPLGVHDRNAHVFAAVNQHHGSSDVGGVVDRRVAGQLGLILADGGLQVALAIGRELDVAAAVHQLQIAQADVADRAAEHLRFACGTHQRGVAAKAGADDAGALAVGVALRDGPTRGVDQVVDHAAAPLPIAGSFETLAIATGAAEVHLQHGVAATGQQLRPRLPQPAVACAMRAAVGEHHERRQGVAVLGRGGQVAVQGEPVP